MGDRLSEGNLKGGELGGDVWVAFEGGEVGGDSSGNVPHEVDTVAGYGADRFPVADGPGASGVAG